MITDTVKGYVYGGAAALLALSLLGNAIQYHLVGNANERATQAESNTVVAQDAANACSASIDSLKTKADEAARLAKSKIEAAKLIERHRAASAQNILATPPSVPGNDCASALDRASSWLKAAE